MHDHGGAQAATGEPIADEHILLDDNKYIADIMCEFRNSKLSREVGALSLLPPWRRA